MTPVLEDFSLGKKMQQKGVLQKVGIVGCGSMGQQIAILTSQYGIDVVFIDLSGERIQSILKSIEKQLDEKINRWGLTHSEKKAILSRIKGSTEYNDLNECNLVIETINSKKPGTSLELRKEIFRKVEESVSKDTIITSNTATLMISDIASSLKFPERAVGVHFISPVDKIKILEVVRSIKTSKEAYEFVVKYAKMINKQVINVNESPGNISTRMIIPFLNEACEILMEGIASISDIDETLRQASGHQFGPFEMADRIGLNNILKWSDNLYSEFGEQKYKASPVIKRLVRANYLGVKSGRGFYKYDGEKITGETIHCTEFQQ